MKKFLFIIIVILLFSACSDGGDPDNTSKPTGDSQNSSSTDSGEDIPNYDNPEYTFEDTEYDEDQEQMLHPTKITGFEDNWRKCLLGEAKENLGGFIWLPSTELPSEEQFELFRYETGTQETIDGVSIPMAKIIYNGLHTYLTIQIIKEPDIVESYMDEVSMTEADGFDYYFRAYENGARISWQDGDFAVLLDGAFADYNVMMNIAKSIRKQ